MSRVVVEEWQQAGEVERAYSPGLGVVLDVEAAEDPSGASAVSVRVDVEAAARPLRVSVFLDGDLVDTWTPTRAGYALWIPGVSGRHVLTARAIDGTGRWGGASAVVDVGAA